MAPNPGWYPDPLQTADLRYWDGVQWTTATSAIPGLQQVVPSVSVAQAIRPYGYAKRARTSRLPRGKAAVALVAAIALVVCGLAVGIPLASGDKSANETANGSVSGSIGPSGGGSSGGDSNGGTGALSLSLLSADEVSSVAGAAFSVQPESDDSGGKTTTDCLQASGDKSDAFLRGKASRQFGSNGIAALVFEEVDYYPGHGSAPFDELRQVLKVCHQSTQDGLSMTFEQMPVPAIAGSDDALGLSGVATGEGRVVYMAMAVARVGDNAVAVMAIGADQAQARALDYKLLQQATNKAKAVLGTGGVRA